MARKRLTVADIAELKGKRQLTMLRIFTIDEAAAAEESGIDLVSAPPELVTNPKYRQYAPSLFTLTGTTHLEAGTPEEYLKVAGDLLNRGADAIYCSGSIETISYPAREYIPVVGHLGLVPARVSWTGGYRAVGKTAEEAMALYHEALRLEEAGAIAAEIEVVPVEVARTISQRLKRLSLWSMGSGPDCDAQYLFAMDILGEHRGHMPRHSKVYRNFAVEYDRLQAERIAAFKEFRADVDAGQFPEEGHVVRMVPDQLESFMARLDGSLVDEAGDRP